MKHKIAIDVPTAEDIARGLDTHGAHPGLAPAELLERQRAHDLEALRQQLTASIVHAERIAADVQQGRAPDAALAAALRARDMLAIRHAPAEAALAAATVSRELGYALALTKLRAEGLRRNSELQQLADTIAPVLLAIRDVELDLDAALGRALGQSVSDATGLPAVLWPSCLREDIAANRWRRS